MAEPHVHNPRRNWVWKRTVYGTEVVGIDWICRSCQRKLSKP